MCVMRGSEYKGAHLDLQVSVDKRLLLVNVLLRDTLDQ